MSENEREKRQKIVALSQDRAHALSHLGRLGTFTVEPCDHYDSSDQMLQRMKAKATAELSQIDAEINVLQSL